MPPSVYCASFCRATNLF